jgi:hypothetical protein
MRAASHGDGGAHDGRRLDDDDPSEDTYICMHVLEGKEGAGRPRSSQGHTRTGWYVGRSSLCSKWSIWIF